MIIEPNFNYFQIVVDPLSLITFVPINSISSNRLANLLSDWTQLVRLNESNNSQFEYNINQLCESINRLYGNLHFDDNISTIDLQIEDYSLEDRNDDGDDIDLVYCTKLWHPIVHVGIDQDLNRKNETNQSGNSVIKFLTDFLAHDQTACLIYQNDLNIIIDIVYRKLNDLEIQSKVIYCFLIVFCFLF